MSHSNRDSASIQHGTIFGVSRDGPYSHAEFAEAEGIEYPLLSNINGEMLKSYDLLIEEAEGLRDVPHRSVLLIDSDRTVQYKWSSPIEKNYEETDFGLNPVKEAIKSL